MNSADLDMCGTRGKRLCCSLRLFVRFSVFTWPPPKLEFSVWRFISWIQASQDSIRLCGPHCRYRQQEVAFLYAEAPDRRTSRLAWGDLPSMRLAPMRGPKTDDRNQKHQGDQQ